MNAVPVPLQPKIYHIPWLLIERIGVQSANVYRQVVNALPANGHRPTVQEWYY